MLRLYWNILKNRNTNIAKQKNLSSYTDILTLQINKYIYLIMLKEKEKELYNMRLSLLLYYSKLLKNFIYGKLLNYCAYYSKKLYKRL